MREMSYEEKHGPRYAAELDEAAEILQRVHPIGKVKAIGRLEVVTALKELFPADDDEPVTEEWLRSVGFEHDTDGFMYLVVNDSHTITYELPVSSPLTRVGKPRVHKTRGSVRLLRKSLKGE
jgi:hypothetical protein